MTNESKACEIFDAEIAKAREIFDTEIANTTCPDRIAHLEVLREYITNPTFRQRLKDESWNRTKGAS